MAKKKRAPPTRSKFDMDHAVLIAVQHIEGMCDADRMTTIQKYDFLCNVVRALEDDIGELDENDVSLRMRR